MKPNTALSVANYWNTKAMESYIEDRTQELYEKLSSCTPEDLLKLQGALQEIRRLREIPKIAQGVLEIENGRKESNSPNRSG